MIGIYIVVALGVGLLIATNILLSAYIVFLLWGWFMIPLGLAQISIAHAIGLSCGIQHKSDPEQSVTNAIATMVAIPLLSLAIGYVAHMFM